MLSVLPAWIAAAALGATGVFALAPRAGATAPAAAYCGDGNGQTPPGPGSAPGEPDWLRLGGATRPPLRVVV